MSGWKYALLIVYVIITLFLMVVGGALNDTKPANQRDSYWGILLVPLWPLAIPLIPLGLMIQPIMETIYPPVITRAPVQPVVDIAKTKEATDAATREKTVAVIADAKAAAAAPVVDTTAAVVAK